MQDVQGVSHLDEVMGRISGWLREKLATNTGGRPNQAMQRMTYSLPLARPLGLPINAARVPAAPFAHWSVCLASSVMRKSLVVRAVADLESR